MTYPNAALGVRIRAAIGIVDMSTDPSTWPWLDITRDIDHLIEIVDDIGGPDDVSEPSTTLSFALKQDGSVYNGIVGRYTTDNPESDLWPYFDVGCPIEYALDVGDGGGYDVQCVTFVSRAENAWPSNTQYKSVAQISCVGLLQRGGVLTQAQRSPMFRTVMDRRNLGFWALEDAQGSTTAASAISGQAVMERYGGAAPFEFGSQALVPGVSSGVHISTGQAMRARLTRPGSGTGLRIGFLFYAGTNPAGYSELVSFSDDRRWRWALEIGPSVLRVRVYDDTGAERSGAGSVSFTDHLNGPVFCEFEISQSGGTTTWTIREAVWRLDSAGVAYATAGFATGTFAGSWSPITNIGVAIFTNVDDVWMSSLAATEPPFPASGGFAAVLGWAGNTAAGRVAGMAAELGVPYSVTSSTYGVPMGPQLIDTLRANMLDVAATDHGVLSDHLGKIAYRALQELYNLSPIITLTRAVRGQLGQLAPVRDDTAKVNRVTVTRAGGSSYTADNTADIITKGLFEGSAPGDLNVALDTDLPSHAGWFLARGIANGYRYDELTLRMRTAGEYTPTLPGLVTTLQLGDRIAISSLPPSAGKLSIERQVRGRRQSVLNRGMKAWDVTYRMVPVEAYQAFILDTDRLDTSGTEVMKAATAADTLIVTGTAGALPATGTGQSIALDMAGEQVTLTGVATEASGDTWTRTVANGWGSMPASTNLPAMPWAFAGGVAGDYAANGTQGAMTNTSAANYRSMHLQAMVAINTDYTVFNTVPVLATGGNIEIDVFYRFVVGPNNGYSWRVCLEPGGTTRLNAFAPGVGTIVDIPLPFTHTAGATYGIRVAPIGSLHRCKVWQGTSTATEPSSFTVEIQDTTRLTAGYPILRNGRAAGNTNASLATTWDNLTFNNLQAFTVTRSQGVGVIKAQAVGNQIKLWRGKGLGI